MEFKLPSTMITWLVNTGATFFVCVCLLSCGCQPESTNHAPSESPSNQPADKNSADNTHKQPPPKVVEAKPPVPDVNDPQFHSAIKAAAEQYLQFAMVNTSGLGESPTKHSSADSDSSGIILEEPAAKMSQAESDSDSGHGQKLYFLFAKEIGHYVNPDGTASPVGQALVIESWTAVPGNPDARNLRNHASGNRVNPRVTVNDETLKLGQRRDLFVMLKQKPKTEASDDDWVYGVIDPKSHEIKSAGAVASCIACHKEERDRLFRDGIVDWSVKAQNLSEVESVSPDSSASTDSEPGK